MWCYIYIIFKHNNNGDIMNNNIKYNIFLLISSLSRNLVEVFNIALLYKLGYSIKNIFLYYSIFFFISIFVNIITLLLTNYIKCKYILLFSNIIFCLSYYFLNNMNYNIKNLILFAFISSVSSYTYHSIRHYYALKHTDSSNKEIGNIAIFSFIGIIISSYLGPFITDKYSLKITIIIIFILSLISIIPLLLIKDTTIKEKIEKGRGMAKGSGAIVGTSSGLTSAVAKKKPQKASQFSM